MKKQKIAVIGGGPAGFISAVSACENFIKNGGKPENLQIEIFEKNIPLKTILYTGNGRCNLSNNITDFKELASHYPRGEKFLYSVFSKFGVPETIQWFNLRGVKTYVQKDNRIFPSTDMAATIREFFLKQAEKYNIKIIKASVSEISKTDKGFIVISASGSYECDAVILSTGGNSSKANNGYTAAQKLGHQVTELKPCLTSLISPEKWLKELAGVSVKNARVTVSFNKKKLSCLTGDFVFTHNGLSGPVVFDTSAYCCFCPYSSQNPLLLKISFLPNSSFEDLDLETQTDKSVSNVLKKYIPKSLAVSLLTINNINSEKKCSHLNEKDKKLIEKLLFETEIRINSPAQDGEIVTAGGIELKQVNAASMESKTVKNLFFCGEILDIDGLTGGFNLQACWSTGYIAGVNAVKKL